MRRIQENQDSRTKLIYEMRSHIYGNWRTCVTYVFAELKIADYLLESPKDVAQLGNLTETNAKVLTRFLRCAEGLGFALRDPLTEKYSLTQLGELLSSNHPSSQRNAARLNGAAYRYGPWGNLLDVLKDGNCRNVSPTYSRGSLDYLADKPECLEVFQLAMTELSVEENEAIAKSYNFNRFKHVADIGCGHGSFIKKVLELNKSITGTMFDLEATLNSMHPDAANEKTGFFGRLRKKSGDFFKEVPTDCDLYLLKNVIHNWPEKKAEQLLRTIYKGMTACGNNLAIGVKRLLIIENIIPEGSENDLVKWLDLNFAVLVDGEERTLEDYETLLKREGFSLSGIAETPVGRHILEFKIAAQ